jgi:hypothetical protein
VLSNESGLLNNGSGMLGITGLATIPMRLGMSALKIDGKLNCLILPIIQSIAQAL